MSEQEEDVLLRERRRYQWYTGYNRTDEYNKDPQWSHDMCAEDDEQHQDGFSVPSIRFYDKYDPEHMWIRSDKTYGLVNMR